MVNITHHFMPLPMLLNMMLTPANKMVWLDNNGIGLFCIALLKSAVARLARTQRKSPFS
ncbi:MAG: hypothetical protein QX199_09710 [Methylococcaceae bacterium]